MIDSAFFLESSDMSSDVVVGAMVVLTFAAVGRVAIVVAFSSVREAITPPDTG